MVEQVAFEAGLQMDTHLGACGAPGLSIWLSPRPRLPLGLPVQHGRCQPDRAGFLLTHPACCAVLGPDVAAPTPHRSHTVRESHAATSGGGTMADSKGKGASCSLLVHLRLLLLLLGSRCSLGQDAQGVSLLPGISGLLRCFWARLFNLGEEWI